ncbi:hypothetical protein DAEQUDRAFT_347235 [Daedalea quercina L-15889]|uniref:Uncharacterized protein n=1 Tax=Daedalea quercina L-15889 TaxID=1314783 RepID=A0A165PCR1_9APHY|nr:hypothetical protein DAEQUDRAFT_347235 [Daedalea quercina L-15889]
MDMDADPPDVVVSAPTPEVNIADAVVEEEPAAREETQEALTSHPVVESVPSPEVEISDAEPEKEGGYESDNEEVGGRQDRSIIPDAVESTPTPEIDIKDADEKVMTQPSSPVEAPEPATESVPVSPVHVHSQLSAAVELTPNSPLTEQLMPEVAHVEMCPVTAGEPSMSIAHQDEYPATPTLSSSQDNAESEDEGPGTPLMGLAPNIVVTPAVEHEDGRGDFESKEPEGENKVDAARELRMARERELF